ncbi:hypothetical protein PCH70_07300 [Pseudomonas cichorii JBC1]|nr:hypothetical protein PCH70_07300 [Pseudomonas cichorii JBC1]
MGPRNVEHVCAFLSCQFCMNRNDFDGIAQRKLTQDFAE